MENFSHLLKLFIAFTVLVLALGSCTSKKSTENPSDQLAEAEWYLDQGDFYKSIEILDEIIRKYPLYEPAYITLSSVYLSQVGLTYLDYISFGERLMNDNEEFEKERVRQRDSLLLFLQKRSNSEAKKWIRHLKKLLVGIDKMANTFDYFQRIPGINIESFEAVNTAYNIVAQLSTISKGSALYRAFLKLILFKYNIHQNIYFKEKCILSNLELQKGMNLLKEDVRIIFSDLMTAYPVEEENLKKDLLTIENSFEEIRFPGVNQNSLFVMELIKYAVDGEVSESCL